MDSSAIEIRDLRKQYRQSYGPALDGLDLDVAAGSITALLGPNGAGKSTTINILCGVIRPDSGTVRIFGSEVFSHLDALRRRIGIVPQQIALFATLTGYENLMYIGRLYGIDNAVLKKKLTLLLERFDLAKHAHKSVEHYSGGMKRRANIIAALLHEPDLLILDEPTAGVDVQSRALILDFLEEFRKGDKTILYTSHLMDEAERLCDHVIIVDEGRWIAAGSPAGLVSATEGARKLEDVFLAYTGRSVRE